MKKYTAVFLITLVIIYTVMGANVANAATDAALGAYYAKAAILIDAETGRVLSERNADEKLPVASTTKILTALVVLRSVELSDTVTVTDAVVGVEASSIYLSPGEHLTVEQLLYGLMLESGNDAAVALAVHVSGTVTAFCEVMNETARAIGATNSNFANPNGLPNDNHYSTARDMALITRAALIYISFRRIVSADSYRAPWEGKSWDRVFKNKNKLLRDLEGCIGVKTGYTKKAGRCLVTAAERDGMTLISVVLNCPDMWGASAAMIEYGFEHAIRRVLLSAGEEVDRLPTEGLPRLMPVYAAEPLTAIAMPGEYMEVRMELPDIIPAPGASGSVVGRAVALVGGIEQGSVPLVVYAAHSDGMWEHIRRVLMRWRL